MFRDFSDAAKERLLGYIDESAPTQSWGSLADILSGLKYSVWEWLLQLNLTNSISDVENYQQQMIEKHDASVAQIEKIFTDVNTADGHYGPSSGTETLLEWKRKTKRASTYRMTLEARCNC